MTMPHPSASSPPELSIVVPTRDRVDRLLETLDAVRAQLEAPAPQPPAPTAPTAPGAEPGESEALPPVGSIEVLVVDDGSRPDSLSRLESELARREPTSPAGFHLRLERCPARGPAAARNHGVRLARAERVLLLGDDTRPAPGTLARHLAAAADRAVAVQGRVDWDPTREITPVMRFLAPEGPQFYFRGLADGRPVPYSAVLGSNLSAPRSWLLEEPFDEGFPFAAVEDTEMAWRWRERGWSTLYAARAVCWHHHPYDSLEPFLERQRRAGVSARRAVQLHPALLWPLIVQPTAFGLVVRLRRLAGRGRPTDAWDLACRRALVRGYLFGETAPTMPPTMPAETDTSAKPTQPAAEIDRDGS